MPSHRPFLYRSRLYILSGAVGAAASCVLLLLVSLVMYIFSLPAEIAEIPALVALGGGCAVSGFVAGNIRRRHGLTVGFRSGLILFAVCAAAAVTSGSAEPSDIAVKAVVSLITGGMGGVVGVNYDM